MLVIKTKFFRENSVQYILNTIFQEFIGVEYDIQYRDQPGFCIEYNNNKIELSDDFFCSFFNNSVELPSLPLSTLEFSESELAIPAIINNLPILYGLPEIQVNDKNIKVNFDIFGSIFFMLSRYEEIKSPFLDNHNRFPGLASLAYKGNFLERPIVDEYVEVLWSTIKFVWPHLKRKKNHGKIRVTCDIDIPFDCTTKNINKLALSLVADILKRRDISRAILRFRNYLSSKRGFYQYDPYYTFNWYMDACEKEGRKISFYFISEHTAGVIDGCYDINEARIYSLMQNINERGHEIGVHSSYNSYDSSLQIKRERDKMIEACKQAGVNDSVLGNRQHYLRWDVQQTPDHLDAAGYEYDTSGSFADLPGFRFGTSRTFKMWSWKNNAALRILQRPLVLMECSVIAKRYMGLGYTEVAMKKMQKLKNNSLAFGGDFTILWHNSHLLTDKDKEFFVELIS